MDNTNFPPEIVSHVSLPRNGKGGIQEEYCALLKKMRPQQSFSVHKSQEGNVRAAIAAVKKEHSDCDFTARSIVKGTLNQPYTRRRQSHFEKGCYIRVWRTK